MLGVIEAKSETWLARNRRQEQRKEAQPSCVLIYNAGEPDVETCVERILISQGAPPHLATTGEYKEILND